MQEEAKILNDEKVSAAVEILMENYAGYSTAQCGSGDSNLRSRVGKDISLAGYSTAQCGSGDSNLRPRVGKEYFQQWSQIPSITCGPKPRLPANKYLINEQ